MSNSQRTFDPQLLHLVWATEHDGVAWLTKLNHIVDDTDMIMALDAYDEQQRIYGKNMEAEWRKWWDSAGRESLRSMRDEFEPEMRDEAIQSISDSIGMKAKDLAEFHREYERMGQVDPSPTRRRIFAHVSRPAAMEKEIGRLRARLNQYMRPGGAGDLTDDQIAQARRVPISQFLPPNARGYALCPFHEDTKPSFWTKGGFGYCFSCGVTCDSIGYLMKIVGMSFKESVEALCRS